MAWSSSFPMCRLMISSLPAAVSKCHCPSAFTSGIGIGQLFVPTSRVILSSPSFTGLQPCAMSGGEPLRIVRVLHFVAG